MVSPKSERMDQVLQAIEDHIIETGKFPSTTDIIAATSISTRSVRDTLDMLVLNVNLKVVYEAPKNPTIYLPAYMYDAVLRQEKRPNWMDSYSFSKRAEIKRDIRSQETELTKLNRIEGLLYGTGRRLEESVSTALEVLGISNLDCPYEDPDKWDVSFDYGDFTYIADIKGKSRWSDKKDVAQISQWLQSYVDSHQDADPGLLRGLLIVNHFKDLDPSMRWPQSSDKPPLSEAAERYLRVGGMRFLTTVQLFELVEPIIKGSSTPEDTISDFGSLLREDID